MGEDGRCLVLPQVGSVIGMTGSGRREGHLYLTAPVSRVFGSPVRADPLQLCRGDRPVGQGDKQAQSK